METVLDSVSLNRLVRGVRIEDCETNLCLFLKNKRINLVLDSDKNLLSEWQKTCGVELVKILIIKWESYGSIKFISNISNLPHDLSRALRQYGFRKTMDKFIIRLALETQDKLIVTDDHEFWDPADLNSTGNPASCVYSLLNNSYGVEIIVLRKLFQRLN